jgi:hypothetical protein
MRRAITLVFPFLVVTTQLGCGARTLGLLDPVGDEVVDAPADGGHDTARDSAFETSLDSSSDTPSFETGADTALDTSFDAPDPYTVGQLCSGDPDCSGGGPNPPQCSSSVMPGFPTPVCVEYGCDSGDGTTVPPCGNETGWCLSTGVGQPGICLPRCSFDANGNFTSSCAGKDACSYYLYRYDPSGRPEGLGYCYGGCARDGDCPSGERCQIESGLCTPGLTKFPLGVGATCTDLDAQNGSCVCLYSGATTPAKGYCSQTCRMGTTSGGGACPAGFTCDAFVPKTDPASGTSLFTKVPVGLQGYCLKNCSSDADCAAYGGWCYETAGTGAKTCQFNPPS